MRYLPVFASLTAQPCLVVGGGVDFPLGGRSMGVDLRYSRGLLDVADGVNGSARNEAFAVMWSIALR